MNIHRIIVLPFIACVVAIGGCASNAQPDPPSFSLPPIREDTIARLAVDGRNAFVNGIQVPHGTYVRDGDTVTTGPATSVSVVLNSGASIQLDQNTDPVFTELRKGACILMALVRGQAAVASGGKCVEVVSERLHTSSLIHSVVNIRAQENEMRITVIEGQVDMQRPGTAILRTNDEYVGTSDGRWQVRQLTPADAMATTAWTRAYFRPPARQSQPDYTVPALTAIGVAIGAILLNRDHGDQRPSVQDSAAGRSGTANQARPQTAPTTPAAPVPTDAPPPPVR